MRGEERLNSCLDRLKGLVSEHLVGWGYLRAQEALGEGGTVPMEFARRRVESASTMMAILGFEEAKKDQAVLCGLSREFRSKFTDEVVGLLRSLPGVGRIDPAGARRISDMRSVPARGWLIGRRCNLCRRSFGQDDSVVSVRCGCLFCSSCLVWHLAYSPNCPHCHAQCELLSS